MLLKLEKSYLSDSIQNWFKKMCSVTEVSLWYISCIKIYTTVWIFGVNMDFFVNIFINVCNVNSAFILSEI